MNPLVKFLPGSTVRIRSLYPLGHLRTPFYIRGKIGYIERIAGEFQNPEELALGHKNLPKIPLYRVRFKQKDIWPDYQGSLLDTIDLEIYHHWLEPA
jgi:nitrile hydratase subunit beta